MHFQTRKQCTLIVQRSVSHNNYLSLCTMIPNSALNLTHSLYYVAVQTADYLTSSFTISWGFSCYLPLCNGMIIISLASAYSKT